MPYKFCCLCFQGTILYEGLSLNDIFLLNKEPNEEELNKLSFMTLMSFLFQNGVRKLKHIGKSVDDILNT
jgi:hypothetical protein